MDDTDTGWRRILAHIQTLDAAGDAMAAVDMLAAAVQADHAPAKRLLGMRLLVGDRAPLLPPQGAGLIREAAEQGDADAATLVASLIAAGAYFPQDWRSALDWLCRAAEAGDEPAQGALRVLAMASGGAMPPVSDWAALRAAIDVEALTQAAPNKRTLSDAPPIYCVAHFIHPAICEWLIGRAQNRLHRARVYDAAGARHIVGETRTNRQASFSLFDADLVQIVLQQRIAHTLGMPPSHLEAPAVLHYVVGEEFRDHFDFIDPDLPDAARQIAAMGQRVATALIYLGGEHQGGETDFPTLGVSHHGRAGEALFFHNTTSDLRPDRRTLHAGRAPVSGEKWVFSQFIRSRPILPGASASR